MKFTSGLRYFIFAAVSVCSFCFFAPAIYSEENPLALSNDTLKYEDVRVERVLRADTILLESGETIKLIGLRAFGDVSRKKRVNRDENGFVIEERVAVEKTPVEQSLDFVVELLEGKKIRVEFDVEQKDENFRSLAYVFLVADNTFVNAQILSQGHADLQIQAPNLKYATQLREAYRQGRAYTHGMDE